MMIEDDNNNDKDDDNYNSNDTDNDTDNDNNYNNNDDHDDDDNDTDNDNNNDDNSSNDNNDDSDRLFPRYTSREAKVKLELALYHDMILMVGDFRSENSIGDCRTLIPKGSLTRSQDSPLQNRQSLVGDASTQQRTKPEYDNGLANEGVSTMSGVAHRFLDPTWRHEAWCTDIDFGLSIVRILGTALSGQRSRTTV
ncbi:uncharacterized protein BO88DRAFT_488793 [Aspergillus vadensis CBS 113365]|uniref:Uncharacterized protein n=1 Tax=Aspergillus vadensis (strain CBS 113365 / IMI 142717 / IBT 24658) TaxID=1448311 RepID=A0A319B6B0_ASPVC|nr:hypothetical protein BO88DRAFT_488793 [Aspergillus vadensis CBS 113365]PYH68336.1 hypothetical protein BO88DRAFT_488793 [Aspergillus vadensis CBS 113365]